MKIAAIYARVSLRLCSGQASDQQKEEKTIASQTAALIEFARQENYQVPDEWVFEDEGYSGANLIRPALRMPASRPSPRCAAAAPSTSCPRWPRRVFRPST